ncbi:MAG: MFS transporter [Solirubrobacterales bacterium]|nr:MFS transporter [Solirubrobacterales bacterium]
MRRHFSLLAICLGYFMVILDATIVNVALPSIARDLGGRVNGLQWVVDAYTIVFAGLLLPAGSAGDRLGSRRVFLAGLAVFTLASAGCAVAPSLPVLIAARVLQGAAAATLVPSSLSLLRASYADTRARARAVGIWGAVAGVGAASGPILGGALVAAASWRAVFLVNLPVAAIALTLGFRYLVCGRERQDGGLDPAGQLLGILTLTLLTFGAIEKSVVALAATPFALIAFLGVERGARRPMLPLELFRSRAFSSASFVGFAINLGFYGQLFVFSLYFQQLRGFSALQTGLALLPEGVFVALASGLSGRLTGRVGPRLPMLSGLLCGAVGFAALLVAGGSTSYPILIPGLLAAGFGMAFTMPAATAAIIDAAPAERAGIASGVLNASRQAGGAIGVAVLGALIASHAFISGLHGAMLVSAGSFLLAAAVVVLTRLPARPRRR